VQVDREIVCHGLHQPSRTGVRNRRHIAADSLAADLGVDTGAVSGTKQVQLDAIWVNRQFEGA
jgi:hypothetical protein